MRRRASSGAPWEAVVGYSRATRAGEHVYVTGTTAFSPEGGHVGDGNPYAQTRQALANVQSALQELGARLEDVVRTRMFVVDIERDWQAIGRAHSDVLGHVQPATSMVEVRRLIAPWMLVEVEADAVVGSGGGGRRAGASAEAPDGVEVGPAGVNEHAAFAALLEGAGLPVPDERDAPVSVRFARRDGEVVGCVGCERHGDDALLRSLVVSEPVRSSGVATALVRSLLADLDAGGVGGVYLFTLAAARFFERFGFEPVDRAALPGAIARSREGVMHACDEAVPMRRGRARGA